MTTARKYFYQGLCLLFLISSTGFTDGKFYSLPDPKTQEEALFLRRIAEFWNEGNFDIVKAQTTQFLSEYPESSFADTLHAILGDLHMRDKNFQGAVTFYSKIKDPAVSKEFLLNKLQCLRELGWHNAITEECEPHLDTFAASDPQKHQKLLYILADAHYNLAMRSPKSSDSRRIYAKQAKLRYESLLDSEFAKDVISPLAYTYHLLGDSKKAAELYLTLAQKHPARKEEMLFQAASLQVEFDKDLAIQTFGQVCHLGKSKAPEAAYNRMILYYETKKYPEIILAKEQLLHLVPKEKVPLLHFFLGRSYFALEDYKRASQELSLFIESDYQSDEERKLSFLTLLDCASLLEENPLFEKILSLYQTRYPDSPDLPHVLFTKAMMNKQLSQYDEAKKDFQRIFADFPNIGNREKILYEYAHLLYLCKNWEASRKTFKEFVAAYQESPFAPLAWRFLINASIESESRATNSSFAKEILATDLEDILHHSHLLSDKEYDELSFMLAKIDYEVEDYESSMAFLQPFLRDAPDSPLAPVAHLLLAYCYRKAEENLEKFCFHAETALALKPDLQEQQLVHLALYNAYLDRNSQNTGNFWDQAAEHLYLAKAAGAKLRPINQSWLATFYHDKVKKFFDRNWKYRLEENSEINHMVERAIQLLEIPGDDQERLTEVITLADLYGLQGKFDKQVALLERIQETSVSEPHKKQARFDLAKAYAQIGKKEKALPLFEEIAVGSSLQNYIAAYSTLQSARLRFLNLKDKAMKADDPEMIAILTKLKDLTIQKTFANEPIHLEAALDYVDIQSFLQNGEETKSILLENTIRDFEFGEDILTKDYQAARKQMPEKESTYSAYLTLMEAEYLLAMASLASGQSKPDEEKAYKKEAYDLLMNISSNPPTAYIYNRSQKALAACGNL